jgi:hypothetical protein
MVQPIRHTNSKKPVAILVAGDSKRDRLLAIHLNIIELGCTNL